MQETGKQRASRIPLDYFKSPDYYARMKGRLTAIVFVVALIYVGFTFVPGLGHSQFSRGPVAHVHAIWDSQCTACHTPFEPISEQSWSKSLFGSGGSERCITCHAGPPHHANATPDLGCAACHREHQGRDASLVRLPNQDCTRCHANLPAHATGKTDFRNVTDFSKSGHPEFRLPEKASRGLKFSHARHMSIGMTLPGQDKQTGFRVRDLAAADRERYAPGVKDLDTPIQLNCASCHQLEAGDFARNDAPASLRPRGGIGDYMVPITYDNQCKACHPLALATQGERTSIPHGMQPEEVKQFVWGALAERKVRKLMADWQPPANRPLPGKEYSEKKVAAEIDDLVSNRLEKFLYREALSDAEKLLFLGEHTCGRCHEVAGEGTARRIVPTQVPNVWFKHAKFNHSKHRALDCLACHDKATTSGRDGLVLIPKMDNCVQCHASPAGAARSDCTECHSYHHRPGVAGIGLGAAARDPAMRVRGFDEFLQGTANPKSEYRNPKQIQNPNGK